MGDGDRRLVVVTGANGLVGERVCAALLDRGARVRAVVRRPGTAPSGTTEHVGTFHEPDVATEVVTGASAVVSTVHPLGADRATQEEVAVDGTPRLARAARDAGVARFVHISTAAVYERVDGVGDIDEHGTLVDDDAGAYAVTKRDADVALAGIDGMTTVLVRPPAVLGPGATSVWNTLRPRQVAEDPDARRAIPDKTFAWIHVEDLAALVADLATGVITLADEEETGPVAGKATAVNAAADRADLRSYHAAVCDALGVEPQWQDGPAWTGALISGRARRWGWEPQVSLEDALAELREGLTEG